MAHNTLILMSDEHNPFYSSPYGHDSVITPNMQRLADEGTRYSSAYTPCPLCMPCRSSFQSGLRVHQVQAYNNCALLLPEHLPTLGDALGERGVIAGFTGKTHIYKDGSAMGYAFSAEVGKHKLPGDANFIRPVRQGSRKRADGYGVRDDAYDEDTARVDAAINWIGSQAPHDRPWVLAVNISAPHFPHFATQDLWDLYKDGGDLPAYGPEEESARHPVARQLKDYFETDLFSEEQTRGLRRGYLACVTYVDRQLGRLLEGLEEGGFSDSTNVLYTSDHGEMLGKFGMWWKCSLYEDSVRVPLLATGPDFAGGGEVTTPVDLHDVRAAAFAAAGVTQPDGWHGTPLQTLAAEDPERAAFSEYHGHGVRAASYMIRRGRWKLHYHVGAPNQLFDLEGDPDELVNLYESKPEVAAELEQVLRGVCDPEKESRRSREFVARQAKEVTEAYPNAAIGD